MLERGTVASVVLHTYDCCLDRSHHCCVHRLSDPRSQTDNLCQCPLPPPRVGPLPSPQPPCQPRPISGKVSGELLHAGRGPLFYWKMHLPGHPHTLQMSWAGRAPVDRHCSGSCQLAGAAEAHALEAFQGTKLGHCPASNSPVMSSVRPMQQHKAGQAAGSAPTRWCLCPPEGTDGSSVPASSHRSRT